MSKHPGFPQGVSTGGSSSSKVNGFIEVLEFMPVPAAIATAEGTVIFQNRQFDDTFGYTSDDFHSISRWMELAYPEAAYRKQVIEIWNNDAELAIREQCSTPPREYRVTCKNGGIKQVIISMRPVENIFLTVFNDITERKRMEEALRNERDFNRALVESSPAFFVAIDADGKTAMMNDTMLKALGYSAEEAAGKDYLQTFVPPGDRASLLPVFQQLTLMRQPTKSENRIMAKDGRELLVEWHGQPVFKGSGMDYFFGVGIDITERQQAEKALRESNELLSLFIHNSPIFTFIKDVTPTESRVLMASENYREMIGIPGSEMAGKTMAELFPAGFAAKITADDWSVISAGQVLRLEEELNGRSYTTIKFPIQLDGKNWLAGYTIDMTERKEAEEKLRRSQERLSMFFNQSIYGYYCSVLDEPLEWNDSVDKEKILESVADHQYITEINDAMLSQYGARREDFAGRPMSAFFRHDQENARSFRRKLFDDGHLHLETFEIKEDGNPVWIEGDYQCIYDGRHRIIGTFGIQLDVTERKKAQQEREKLQAQLNQAQKMESVGRLAGGVAHDFNNMLSVILGRVEMAIDEAVPGEELHTNLAEIQKAAERSAGLTKQLLAFARKQTVAPKVLDVNGTVEGMLNMLKRLIGEDIALDWKPGNAVWPVLIDPGQLDHMLANLCVNARDAIAGVGRITIRTENAIFDPGFCAAHPDFVPGKFVRLSITDTGSGMSEEILAHLFEPFFTTKGVGKGTGLGLATVYGMVKQNNGFIDVRSKPGEGSSFLIYLPRYAGKAAGQETGIQSTAVEKGHETILLVEDEPAILSVTAEMMKRIGYRVLPARTPGEAVQIAREAAGQIHLLMTDVVMPEMNGRELAKNLLTLYPDLRRLFISGYTADIIAPHGVLEPGVHFLQKPFTLSDLAKKIRETLDEE